MHYVIDFLSQKKYHKFAKKLRVTSHFDVRSLTDDRKQVIISHGAGEFSARNTNKRNSDYYLVWNIAEYKNLTKEGYKAYLVGSVYNERTTPDKFYRDTLTYIPQHCNKTDLIKRKKLDVNNKLVKIPELGFSVVRHEELERLARSNRLNKIVTSVVDDTNAAEFKDHSLLYSDRNNIDAHFAKCKYLYAHTHTALVDIYGTFDLVGANHGIKFKFRQDTERCQDKNVEEYNNFVKDNYSDMIDMPMKNNEELIFSALEEIYGECK